MITNVNIFAPSNIASAENSTFEYVGQDSLFITTPETETGIDDPTASDGKTARKTVLETNSWDFQLRMNNGIFTNDANGNTTGTSPLVSWRPYELYARVKVDFNEENAIGDAFKAGIYSITTGKLRTDELSVPLSSLHANEWTDIKIGTYYPSLVDYEMAYLAPSNGMNHIISTISVDKFYFKEAPLGEPSITFDPISQNTPIGENGGTLTTSVKTIFIPDGEHLDIQVFNSSNELQSFAIQSDAVANNAASFTIQVPPSTASGTYTIEVGYGNTTKATTTFDIAVPELPIEVFDALSVNNTDRKAGNRLNYLNTSIDGRWWEATSELVFAGDEGDSYMTSKAEGDTYYPLAQVSYTPTKALTSIEYDIQFGNMSSGWMALGYTKDLNFHWFTGQLWVLLTPSGLYQVYTDGANKLLASGQAQIDANGYTHVKLDYDAVTKTSSLWINGIRYENKISVGDAPLEIHAAGFMMIGQTAYGQKVKNFTVRGESEVVPPLYPDDIVKPVPSDFPIGVFDAAQLMNGKKTKFKQIIMDLQSRGLNAIMLAGGNAEKDDDLLEVSDKFGLDVMYGPHVQTYPWLFDREAPSDKETARNLLAPVVEVLKKHPSVKVINVSDEPELYMMEKHVTAAQVIHELAPGMKVSAPLGGFDRSGPIASAYDQDIFIIDPYPAAKFNPPGDFTMNGVGYGGWDFVSYIREQTKYRTEDTPLWIIMQTHAYDAGLFSLREPLPAEVREQQWLAIGEGATGIFWFIYSTMESWIGLSENEVLFDEVGHLAGRLNPLRETLLGAKKEQDRFTATATGTAQPYVSTLVEKQGNKRYVVAVNTDALSSQKLTIDSNQFKGQLKDLETGQLYTIGESAIELRAGDGKVFEVIPTTVYSEPTVAITSVQSGTTVQAGSQLGLVANAAASEGIAKVTYYANGQEIASSTAAPYPVNWTVNRSGGLSITAVATSTKGVETTSSPVELMVTGPDNLIRNASFEGTVANGLPADWEVDEQVTATLDKTVYRTGGTALKLSGNVTDKVVLKQHVALHPNTEYELNAWIKTNDVKGAGALLQAAFTGPTKYEFETMPLYGTLDWTRVHVKFMTPATLTASEIFLKLDARMNPATVWIDDVSLVPTGGKEISDNLALHWSFDELKGSTVYDLSGNGRHGDIVRAPDTFHTWSNSFDSGAPIGAGALILDGGGNYVKTKNPYHLNANAFSVALWMNLRQLKDQVIFSNEQLVVKIAEGHLNTNIQTDQGQWQTLVGPEVKSLGWRHLAVVYDGAGGFGMYIDGERVAQMNDTGSLKSTAGDTLIGTQLTDNSLNMHGYVDDLRIYERTLSGDELKRLALKLVDSSEPPVGEPISIALGEPTPKVLVKGTQGNVTIPVTTAGILDGQSLTITVKNSADAVQNFEVTGNLVQTNKLSLSITVPATAAAGSYSVEVGYGSVKKSVTFQLSEPESNPWAGMYLGETTANNSTVSVSPQQLKELFAAAKPDAGGIKKLVLDYTQNNAINEVRVNLSDAGINVAEFDEHTYLVIKTEFGTVNVNAQSLRKLAASASDRIVLVIRKGGLIVECLVNDKPVDWSDAAHPLVIELKHDLKSGEKGEYAVAYYESGGTKTFIPQSVYANGKVTFQTTHTGTFDVLYNEKSFVDTKGHWSEKAVNYMAARDVVKGTGNNAFAPDVTVTRADFVTMLVRMLGLKGSTTSSFSDVNSSDYFAKEVEIAKSLGIVNGTGNNVFRPKDTISRQEMFVIAERALQKIGVLQGAADHVSNLSQFKDADAISGYARDSISVLYAEGLVSGFNGNLLPSKHSSRAEAAQFLMNVLVQIK